jgi:hypothetical protein
MLEHGYDLNFGKTELAHGALFNSYDKEIKLLGPPVYWGGLGERLLKYKATVIIFNGR